MTRAEAVAERGPAAAAQSTGAAPCVWRRLAAALAVALSIGSTGAHAEARICIGNDVIQFGNRVVGSHSRADVTVANCGDQAWSFTEVGVHPATGTAFAVSTTCATGSSLAPGDRCAAAVEFAPMVTGQTSGGLWLRNTTAEAPDELLTFYGRGVDGQAGTATLSFAPAAAAFGSQPLGVQSAPLAIAVANAGPAALTPTRIVLTGAAAYDFDFYGGTTCREGTAIAAGQACTLLLYFLPQATGARLASLVIDAPQLASLAVLALSGTGTVSGTSTANVVEFYHQGLDHYFITWMPGEIAGLDAGTTSRGWARTGFTFKTYPAAQAATTPVCRYYIPPGQGDSHFFGRGTVECDATGRKYPAFVLEDAAFMQMFLPAAGVCPQGTVPIYRVFSNRADANHRYMTSRIVRDQMVALGWLAEGDGPDLVVMCAPA